MDDTKDIREMLEEILLQEMRNLDLSFVPGAELRRQNLIKATQQLTSIAREFDNYSSMPEIFEVRLRRVSSEINSIWNELNKKDFFNNENEKKDEE
tara:strand:- start:1051 stop:1338 length:288 start_codon:yes stop_codon:yes gene_type:complete